MSSRRSGASGGGGEESFEGKLRPDGRGFDGPGSTSGGSRRGGESQRERERTRRERPSEKKFSGSGGGGRAGGFSERDQEERARADLEGAGRNGSPSASSRRRRSRSASRGRSSRQRSPSASDGRRDRERRSERERERGRHGDRDRDRGRDHRERARGRSREREWGGRSPRERESIDSSECRGAASKRLRDEDVYSSTALIRGLPRGVPEDKVEELVRSRAIAKRFSIPDAVRIESLPLDALNRLCASESWISRSLAAALSRDTGEAGTGGEASSPATEKQTSDLLVAFVDFPSTDAALKFKRSCRNDALLVGGRSCPVAVALQPRTDTSPRRRVAGAGATADGTGGASDLSEWICSSCGAPNSAGVSSSAAASNCCASCGAANSRRSAAGGECVSGGGWGFEGVRAPSAWLAVSDVLATPLAELLRSVRRRLRRESSQAAEAVAAFLVKDGAGPARPSTFAVLRLASPEDALVGWRVLRRLRGVQVGGSVCRVRPWVLGKQEAQHLLEMLRVAAPDRDFKSSRLGDSLELSLKDLADVAKNSGVWERLLRRCEGALLPLEGNRPPVLRSRDSQSGYLFDADLDLYFDATSSFYMNSAGDYYLHDPAAAALRRVCSYADRQRQQQPEEGQAGTAEAPTTVSPPQQQQQPKVSVVASLVAAAQRSAQATKDAIEKARVRVQLANAPSAASLVTGAAAAEGSSCAAGAIASSGGGPACVSAALSQDASHHPQALALSAAAGVDGAAAAGSASGLAAAPQPLSSPVGSVAGLASSPPPAPDFSSHLSQQRAPLGAALQTDALFAVTPGSASNGPVSQTQRVFAQGFPSPAETPQGVAGAPSSAVAGAASAVQTQPGAAAAGGASVSAGSAAAAVAAAAPRDVFSSAAGSSSGLLADVARVFERNLAAAAAEDSKAGAGGGASSSAAASLNCVMGSGGGAAGSLSSSGAAAGGALGEGGVAGFSPGGGALPSHSAASAVAGSHGGVGATGKSPNDKSGGTTAAAASGGATGSELPHFCFVCLRKFRHKTELLEHQLNSKLHRRNLVDLEQIKEDESLLHVQQLQRMQALRLQLT